MKAAAAFGDDDDDDGDDVSNKKAKMDAPAGGPAVRVTGTRMSKVELTFMRHLFNFNLAAITAEGCSKD